MNGLNNLNMRRLIFLLPLLFFSISLFGQSSKKIKSGIWRGVLLLPGKEELAFNFQVGDSNGLKIYIQNSEEKIEVKDIRFKGDSVIIKLPVFDTEIRAKQERESLNGVWINHTRKTNNTVPFKADYGPDYRYISRIKPYVNFTGKWEVDFSKGTPDSSKAIGLFKQDGEKVTGTFLTPTGDYRYLDGIVEGDMFRLSCFDGIHAYLFKAEMELDGTIRGLFWSSAHWKELWEAKRNEKFELPDPYSLTYLRPGYDRIEFTFPDLKDKRVSLSDKAFQNKVVIVQIMGSWCPNCMDESVFLKTLYSQYHSKGLEIIGLDFEKQADSANWKNNIARMKKDLGIDYTVLFAGMNNNASKSLPMLNQVLGFPTTIVIDKKGKARKIHTGYTGPATGKYYDRFVEEFTGTIEKLLSE